MMAVVVAEHDEDEQPRQRLARAWRTFAAEECRGYSPLYERICHAVAEADDVLDIVMAAPLAGWQPNVLLAAVHDLVLAGLDHPLADCYCRAEAEARPEHDDAGELFCDVVRTHPEEIAHRLATRRTNTNECGRSAVLVPALRWFVDRLGGGDRPIALLDAGASAGLNLRLDRYLLDYGDGRTTGPADSAVRIACKLVGPGHPPVAERSPDIAARIGLDRAPVDLTDDDEVRWLLACVWPDTGRLARTRAAIELARNHPVEIVRGDVIDDLGATAALLPADLPLAVTTSWVLAYVPRPHRERLLGVLAGLSEARTVAWISAEGAGVAPGVPSATTPPPGDGVTRSVVAGVVFDRGTLTTATVLGHCHPHGSDLVWSAPL